MYAIPECFSQRSKPFEFYLYLSVETVLVLFAGRLKRDRDGIPKARSEKKRYKLRRKLSKTKDKPKYKREIGDDDESEGYDEEDSGEEE